MGTGDPSFRISPLRLRFELARRGRRLGDLTHAPDSVSWATLSRVKRGVAIRLPSAKRIARKLKGWPINPELDQILQAPAEGQGFAPVPSRKEPSPQRPPEESRP
jgi:hypothetical protein